MNRFRSDWEHQIRMAYDKNYRRLFIIGSVALAIIIWVAKIALMVAIAMLVYKHFMD